MAGIWTSMVFSILAVSLGAQAQETSSDVCSAAKASVRPLSAEEREQNVIFGVAPSHQARVSDAWRDGGRSALQFESRPPEQRASGEAIPLLGPWASNGDVLVIGRQPDPEATTRPSPTMQFFVRRETPEYRGHAADVGANGGYFRVERADRDGGVTCPTANAAAWAPHFSENLRGGEVFCIRSPHADRYALIRVQAVCADGLVLQYRYGGESSSGRFAPHAPAVPSPR